jgi:hypothetical protein
MIINILTPAVQMTTMTEQTRSPESDSRRSIHPIAARATAAWRRLDADWQSTLIAAVIATAVTVADLHVPW